MCDPSMIALNVLFEPHNIGKEIKSEKVKMCSRSSGGKGECIADTRHLQAFRLSPT
jgi:hypothetical protein